MDKTEFCFLFSLFDGFYCRTQNYVRFYALHVMSFLYINTYINAFPMLFFCLILYLTFYRCCCFCCRYCSDIVNNDNYIPVDNVHIYKQKGNNITENRQKRPTGVMPTYFIQINQTMQVLSVSLRFTFFLVRLYRQKCKSQRSSNLKHPKGNENFFKELVSFLAHRSFQYFELKKKT